MSVTGYLTEHWGLIVILIGLLTIIFSDTHLELGMLRRMIGIVILLFVYSTSSYIEAYLGNQPNYTILRPILSAVNYSLIVYILVNIILIVYPKHNFFFWIPATLNFLLCFISIKTKIVFYISETNHFGRGRLGYLTYWVCLFYLVYLIVIIFHNVKTRAEDYTLPIFMTVSSILCLAMPLVFEDMATQWFNMTIAINILFYYIYVLQQYTKRDSLTNLLNRQSYYRDAEKYMNSITAYVALDMNGLKEINDQDGHLAGDHALKVLADCFWEEAHHSHRIYRIGGDEYAILCFDISEEEVKELIQQIQEALKQTSYSCSIGYAMKQEDSTLDTLYQSADEMLYHEKQNYYERTGKKRHHS
ncbi:MAG: GGDEF domain-containing protein [Eubacterium sp.]|nr:GGDEF domain-containing protein [Eubacterium sp.]